MSNLLNFLISLFECETFIKIYFFIFFTIVCCNLSLFDGFNNSKRYCIINNFDIIILFEVL